MTDKESLLKLKTKIDKYIARNLIRQNIFTLEDSSMETSFCAAPSLKSERTLQDALDHIDDTFQEAMFHHIDAKGMDEVDVYTRAHVDRKLFSKIRSDAHYQPSKKTAVCICIGLMLNLDETLDLLGRAGYTLSHSSKADLITEYFIKNRDYDLMTLNQILYEYGEPTLYV